MHRLKPHAPPAYPAGKAPKSLSARTRQAYVSAVRQVVCLLTVLWLAVFPALSALPDRGLPPCPCCASQTSAPCGCCVDLPSRSPSDAAPLTLPERPFSHSDFCPTPAPATPEVPGPLEPASTFSQVPSRIGMTVPVYKRDCRFLL
jgi:hypothetical protein